MAVFGHGTTLALGSAVANLTNISGPSLSADTIDVTTYDSVDGFREFIAGLKDAGEVSFEGNFDNVADANAIISLLASGEIVVGATIVIPLDGVTSATFTFDCIVTAYETTIPHDDKVTFSATVKVTGKPTLA